MSHTESEGERLLAMCTAILVVKDSITDIETYNALYAEPYLDLCDSLWIFSSYLRNEATDVDEQGVYVREFLEQTLGSCDETSKKIDDGLMKYRDCAMNCVNIIGSMRAKGEIDPLRGIEVQQRIDLSTYRHSHRRQHRLQSCIGAMILNRMVSSIRLSCTMIEAALTHTLKKAIKCPNHAQHMF